MKAYLYVKDLNKSFEIQEGQEFNIPKHYTSIVYFLDQQYPKSILFCALSASNDVYVFTPKTENDFLTQEDIHNFLPKINVRSIFGIVNVINSETNYTKDYLDFDIGSKDFELWNKIFKYSHRLKLKIKKSEVIQTPADESSFNAFMSKVLSKKRSKTTSLEHFGDKIKSTRKAIQAVAEIKQQSENHEDIVNKIKVKGNVDFIEKETIVVVSEPIHYTGKAWIGNGWTFKNKDLLKKFNARWNAEERKWYFFKNDFLKFKENVEIV